MEMYYRYEKAMFGHKTCRTEQFIALNSEFQIIFVYISFRSFCSITI
jgi:hypothetical protein